MANAASIVMVEGAPSTLSSPAAGSGTLGVDTSNHPFTLSSGGAIWAPTPNASIVADSASITNTDTLIQSLAIPVGQLAVAATDLDIRGSGTFTAGAAAAPVFVVRAGTLGTTSDAAICTFTLANTGTTGTTIAFFFHILLTMRAVGAGVGTATGTIAITNQGTTGISATATQVVTATGASLALTTPTFVDLTFQTASASNTAVFKTCNIVMFCP